MSSALELGKLLKRSGALMNARQRDVVDDLMGTAATAIGELSDADAGEMFALLFGYFAALCAFVSADYAPVLEIMQEAGDSVDAKRKAITAALNAVQCGVL